MENDPKVEILRNFFRIGVFVGLCGFVMIFIQPRNSPEFVLSVCSALMGGALMLGVLIILRLSR
ncbi:MAG: hypothetical protein EHM39_06550 [Chloroflexi bacterium]|nr:MAG: hypothetical protein EHM39_06550 [Chloroflexota bacterium]